MQNQNIAIDGPAGAGKSTIARKLAQELGMIYIDTGAMYRAAGLYLMEQGIASGETSEVKAVLSGMKLMVEYREGEQCVILNGENYNPKIRTEKAGKAASEYSKLPEIRNFMRRLQQELAASTGVVMDGRDIGTQVLPDAFLKIYLTADSRKRAERRFAELKQKGQKVELDRLEADIIARDKEDMTREESPLRQAEDAELVDTSGMGIEEVVNHILELYHNKKTVDPEGA